MSRRDICTFPGCSKDSDMTYLGKDLCNGHWNKHAEDSNDLKSKLGIKQVKVKFVKPIVEATTIKEEPKEQLNEEDERKQRTRKYAKQRYLKRRQDN